MEKNKADFINWLLDFVDADLDGLRRAQFVKVSGDLRRAGDLAMKAMLPIGPYSGGVSTRRGSLPPKGQEKAFLARIQGELRVRVNDLVRGRYDDEDLGDVRLNYSLVRSDTWSLVVTPPWPPEGMDADLWRILVGLAWALHGRPADCIKRCALRDCQGKAKVVSLSSFKHPNVVEGRDVIPGAVTRETTVQEINQWTRPLVECEAIDGECFKLPEFLEGCTAKTPDGQTEYEPLPPGWRKVMGRKPGKLFLQTTRKRKDYCSHDCAVRAGDSRRRGTEKRREQQRQAGERQYQKKVAGRLGVQPDQVMPWQKPGEKRQVWIHKAMEMK